MDPRTESTGRQLVWDLPLRLCHWALAIAVAGSFVTHEIGTAAFAWHVRFGYATVVLVVFRILWGFVGPEHARFGDFLRGPRAAWTYAHGLVARPRPGEPAAHVAGHNPLGGWMVLAMLALLLVQSVAGLFANDEIVNAGPLYGYVDSSTSDVISRWHRQLSDWILVAVGLHVAAAFFYLLVRRENLIGAMVSGYKRGLPPGAAISGQRIGLALVLVAFAGSALWWIVRTAPEYSLVLF
jgi:cytochrome b